MYFQRKNNKLKAHCNKLIIRTHYFCNVVLELDFLSYYSTDEYPEELDRLIIFNMYLMTPHKCGRLLDF